jgi:hypothetical protein
MWFGGLVPTLHQNVTSTTYIVASESIVIAPPLCPKYNIYNASYCNFKY